MDAHVGVVHHLYSFDRHFYRFKPHNDRDNKHAHHHKPIKHGSDSRRELKLVRYRDWGSCWSDAWRAAADFDHIHCERPSIFENHLFKSVQIIFLRRKRATQKKPQHHHNAHHEPVMFGKQGRPSAARHSQGASSNEVAAVPNPAEIPRTQSLKV